MRMARSGQSSLVGSAIVTTSVLAGIAFVLLREDLLPGRFFYDAQRIQNIAQGKIDPLGDGSFAVVGSIYRLLGLENLPDVASFVGFGLHVAVILLVIVRSAQAELTIPLALLIALAVILGAVFMASYSKDVFVILLVSFALLLPASWRWDLLFVAVVVLYALSMRTYWLLVGVVYLFLRWVISRGATRMRLLLAAFVSVVAVGLAIYFSTGGAADFYRTSVNISRAGIDDASSLISRFITGPEPFAGLANVLLTWITLIIPVPLLILGGAYYLAISTLLMAIWLSTFRALTWLNVVPRPSTAYLSRATALVVAFICVQALFEPDYGSYLRHLTPLLPLIVYVVWNGRAYVRVHGLVQMRVPK